MRLNPLTPFPVLETERLMLREMRKTDLQDVHDYASDPELTKFLTWKTHKTMADTEGFMEFVFAQYKRTSGGPWVVEWKENNRVIGTIDLINDPKHHSAELAYAISREYWRKGIGTEAVRRIFRFGFEQLQLERIYARCHPENTASYKLMEKSGMTFEGILRKSIRRKGKQEDVKMYSILKEEFTK